MDVLSGLDWSSSEKRSSRDLVKLVPIRTRVFVEAK